MVRKNNPVSTIKPGLLFTFLAVSLLLALGLGVVIYRMRQQTISSFAQKMEAITSHFEQSEQQYTTSYSAIITKRTSMPPSLLDSLDHEYSLIQQSLAELTETSQEKTRLELVITQRRSTLISLSEMNAIIIAESSLGTALDSYTRCQKAINYTQKASFIVSDLEKCESHVVDAQTAAKQLPSIAYATCTLEQSPLFLVQLYNEAFDLLKKEYTLGAAEKTIEAAAAEQEYRTKIAKIQSLPKWNSCITTYLQNKSKEVIKN